MSKRIIIDEAGLPKALTVDALRIEKLGVGSEDWAFASGETSSFVKMSIGENAEVDATDYDAQAITEVDVTQDINGIETQPDEVAVTIEPRNVSISEGNQPRIFSPVKKVRVNLQAGGTVDLLPKSSIATGTLYATKRGHYAAKDDGYVGYSKVYVNVPESIDGTGEDGGWTDLPDEIRVTTPPTKTIYNDGETIDYSGMVVTAYKNEQVWHNNAYPDGVIPNEELIFEQTVAHKFSDETTLIKFCRDKVRPDLYSYSSFVPDILKCKYGKYGYWGQNRQGKYFYRLYWVSPTRDNGADTDYTDDDDFATIYLINGIGSGIKSGVILNDNINWYRLSGSNYSDTKDESLKNYAYAQYEQRKGGWDAIGTMTVDGVTFRGTNTRGGVADKPELNDDAPYNLSVSLPSTLDYRAGIVGEVMAYSILFGDRVLPIYWQRPRDNKSLDTQVEIKIQQEVI